MPTVIKSSDPIEREIKTGQFQYQLFGDEVTALTPVASLDTVKILRRLLHSDLTFGRDRNSDPAHKIHAFAAKFPPQLPRTFIAELTKPAENVLDPMVGSGTSILEAGLMGRRGFGVDLDPLSVMISQVKSSTRNLSVCADSSFDVLQKARYLFAANAFNNLESEYSLDAVKFFRYWFQENTINELYCLAKAIRETETPDAQNFVRVLFSSIIITKSSELSLARDLAHSRPHRDLNKKVNQSAFDLFQKRLDSVVSQIVGTLKAEGVATILRGDVRALPLRDDSVHLIFTSPPYASNAIDYMRGHKFSLMWLGYEPNYLSNLRSVYIGSEVKPKSLKFPSKTANKIIEALQVVSKNRASAVANYYCEMESALREMYRVLARGRAAVLVVGSSNIKGIEIQVPKILGELAESVGFDVVDIATRQIPRNARMMPVSHNSEKSGIEARMHEEGVIGLVKPIQT